MSDRRICHCRLALHEADEHEPVSEAQLFRGYGVPITGTLVKHLAQPSPRDVLRDLEQAERRLVVVRSDAA